MLSVQDVVEINKKIGEAGVLAKRGDLEFILDRVKASKSMTKAAAALLYGIITSHVFVDGNKRTAFQTMRAFVILNGKKLVHTQASDEKMESLLYEIAQNKISRTGVEVILEKMIE